MTGRRTMLGMLLGIALMLGLVVAPALATHGPQPSHPESNDASAWEAWLHDGSTCEKVSEENADSYTLDEPPEGFEWSLIVINAGAPGDERSTVTLDPEPGEYENEQTGDVSNVILCQRPIEEQLSLALIKHWTGDDEGDAVATFFIDGVEWDGTPLEVEEGDSIEIAEDVTGLDENCTYVSDPATPFTYVVDSEDAEEGLITLEITNEVDCEVELAEQLALTLVKVWAGDHDGEGVDVTFGLNGVEWDGSAVSVEDGDEIEIDEISVGGIPAGCDWTPREELPFTYVVDAEDADDDGLITLTITNDVECDDDEPPVTPPTPTTTPPTETPPTVTPPTTTEETPPTTAVLPEQQVAEQPETAVLAESEVRPEGVPAGTGGFLPSTGANGLLLLMLTGLGLAVGGFVFRRASIQ